MGGSDQWGNIVNGVELGRRVDARELFGLTSPLITTSSGEKMGKTARGAVWLNAERLAPYDYYQFWRNTDDPDVGRFLRLFTELPVEEIARLAALKDAEINDAKKLLAFEATKLCHGEAAAQDANQRAQSVFEESDDTAIPLVVTVSAAEMAAEGVPVSTIVTSAGFAKTNSEARRLIVGGGVFVNEKPVTDGFFRVSKNDIPASGEIILRVGKKRRARVKAE
jgi:tyrosyl-tRNA synthetase